jgi:CDP-diacylglycerol--serine O-phosphatidyltransferase
MERQARVHFTMIRGLQLADLFTIANGCCGVGAIFHAMRALAEDDPRQLWFAAALVPLAIVFDVLDGRVARWRHSASAMGRELDSLADVVSFGVAPAAIAFAAGLSTILDQVVLMYFALCGLSRLARYNVTAEELSGESGKVRYFEGTPIPTSVVPMGLMLLAYSRGGFVPVRIFGLELHLVALLFAVSGSLMISKTVRIPKL